MLTKIHLKTLEEFEQSEGYLFIKTMVEMALEDSKEDLIHTKDIDVLRYIQGKASGEKWFLSLVEDLKKEVDKEGYINLTDGEESEDEDTH